MIASFGKIPRITPKLQFTAFPPLPLRKIENLLPSMVAIPVEINRYSSVFVPYAIFSKMMGNAPLNTSSMKVKIPGTGPSTRNTFVAPILPLPFVLRSMP